MIIGDVGNRVHILSKNEDNQENQEKFVYETIIDVNDCVLYTAVHNNHFVISTKQGVYLFQIKSVQNQ